MSDMWRVFYTIINAYSSLIYIGNSLSVKISHKVKYYVFTKNILA